MAWTKASVDAGQHTYAEALALMNAAGFSKTELDTFLAYNPGDLYRVPEAFDLATGGVDPLSAGQVARAPIVPVAAAPAALPPVLAGATSGGEASLFLSLSGAPVPASSQPAREYAALVAGSGPVPSAGAAVSGGRGIPWMLILVVAAGAWYLTKGGGR